jgi:putative ABC transport system permease protein
MTDSNKPGSSGIYFRLIAFIGVIVPRRLRADWQKEWQAELQHREFMLLEWDNLNWQSKLDLFGRSLGAFWDALRLQPRRLEDEMFQDLRFGARMLVKSPGFTLAAILSLTIGIGATSAIFSVVNGVVLRPLPYREPDQLVRLWHNKPQIAMTRMPVSGGNVAIWRERAESFESVAAYSPSSSVITGEGEPEQVQGARVSYNLLPTLGYQPFIGRGFLPEENKAGSDKVVILSHKLWQRRFAGDEAVLGRLVTFDHTNPYTVIGVMPPEVSFPEQSEYWTPETAVATGRHDMRGLSVLARLKPGVTPQMAKNEVALINQQLQQQLADDYGEWEAELQPLHEFTVGRVQNALLILFGAVGFVLLIACANVANLLLARAASRQKEMAVRSALGASRGRLLRQLLTESTLLSALGGAGGVLLAYWIVKGLIALNPPDVPRLAQIDVDARVLAFTVILTLLVGLVFGLAPALHASKPNLNNALKEGAAQSSGGQGRWLRYFSLRDVMVVTQMALAVVLLAGAGLLIKSFVKLQQVELGFVPTNVITMRLAPPFNRFPKEQQMTGYYTQLLDALRSVPGVETAAAVTSAPTAGAYMSSPILIAGRPVPAIPDAQRAFVTITSPDYFNAIGNPLTQGRLFSEDDNESSPLVAIINETMARRYFADANPIGQRIALKGEPDKWMEIVGVTADVKQFALEEENKPSFYQPYKQKDVHLMTLVVRTNGEVAALIPTLRSRIQEVDKFTAITRIRTLTDMLSETVAQPRFYALLLALFAAIALTLAALGIYAVTAYSVSQRTHEIGIRLALGAQVQNILRLMMGQGLILILTGVGLGLAIAMALTRLMTGLLFGVSPTDPLIFFLIAWLLAVVALLACLVPARRATRVDPLAALRHE